MTEAFSQLYAYTGLPRSLDSLGVLSKVLDVQPGNSNEWLEPVTDEVYDKLRK